MKFTSHLSKHLLSSFKKTSSGFTLIELLIVIGILGILATALVATIDPFEQLKKATDATKKNVTVEFYNANLRYFTGHQGLPWDVAPAGIAVCNGATGKDISGAEVPLVSGDITPPVTVSSIKNTCLQALIDEGELKTSFKEYDGLGTIYISETDNKPTVCFAPESKSERRSKFAKYNISGGVLSDADKANCKDNGGTDVITCYWCSK